MADDRSRSDRSLLPWWVVIAAVLAGVSMISSEIWGAILVPWQALSFTFSLIPVIALVAYVLDCRKQQKKPSFRGYWVLLRVLREAKRESYDQTARVLLPGDTLRIIVAVLAWLLIVFTWLAGNWLWVANALGL